MMASVTTSSCEICGWMAAICSMLAFGTFGVPIKSKAAKECDIDPLVMQTYKTSMCFLSSWIVLLWGVSFSFTPWGIVSGLFWVPGGVATVFAIKNAGLAIAIGIGASCIVLVSFLWGIFVFDEHVHSRIQACFAVTCMMFSLLGMAYFSAPSVAHARSSFECRTGDGLILMSTKPKYQEVISEETVSSVAGPLSERKGFRDVEDGFNDNKKSDSNILSLELSIDSEDTLSQIQYTDVASELEKETSYMWFCGIRWQRRILGVLAAIFNGCYGGSIMVPMKWSPPEAGGAAYVISFAIGASIVTMSLWVFRYLYLVYLYGPFEGYAQLPSFHFRRMWIPGILCGLLWSTGNFFSILSVKYLGEGIGYSVVQTNMLISGLWGIFYFHEIEGRATICKWYVSAVFAVCGILVLSYEHHMK